MMRWTQNLSINVPTLKRKLISKFCSGTPYYSSLSRDLLSMLNDARDHNVIIKVGQNENAKEFRAHSNILSARSPYFKNAISAGWMIEVNKPNINPTVFEMILKYMYTEEVDLTEQSGANVLELLVASNELLLEDLTKHVQDHLIENQMPWIRQNFVHVLHTIFDLSSCKKLQDHCIESICANPQPFITSKESLMLDKDILYGLLKRDDLQIKEVAAWDYLIKWGIEKTPCLGSENNDINNWYCTDFKALKETLSDFIPLIRFSEINSVDFFDKVYPFKIIIPDDIYNGAMKFYMKGVLPITALPPRLGSYCIKSEIMKPSFTSTIINWIEKKDAETICNKNSLYRFNLIYRGIKNDIDDDSFKRECNLQNPILILIKCRNSRKIFGGYTDVGFYESNIGSADCFIFSLENDYDLENDDYQVVELSRVTRESHAIITEYDHGFNFGDALYMQNQHLYVGHMFTSYEKNVSNGYYEIEKIEAYSVVKVGDSEE